MLWVISLAKDCEGCSWLCAGASLLLFAVIYFFASLRFHVQWIVTMVLYTLIFLQLNIVEGKIQYLFDVDEYQILGCLCRHYVYSFGHCHLEVDDTIVKQRKILKHATAIYFNQRIMELAKALATKVLGNLKILSIDQNMYIYVISFYSKTP